MGCHTWFYEKIEVSYEDAKKYLIDVYNGEIDLLSKWYNNPMCTEYIEYCEIYPEYTSLGFMYNMIELYKRRLRIIEKGLCKEAVMSNYSHRYVKNKGHYKSLDWCDIFRIGNYPEDKLFSLDETLEFIEKNKDKIYYYHNLSNKDWKQLLEDYWIEYSDGMIAFG